MKLGRTDAMLEFGEVTLSSGTIDFPNIVNVGEGKVDRMRVAANVTVAGTGGTAVVLKLLRSDDNSTYTEIAASKSAAASAAGDFIEVAIPEGYGNGYLKLQAVCTGTFTAGKITAGIDHYMGV